MNWTNVFKLPVPFAKAIEDDLYHQKRQDQLLRYCEKHGLPYAKIKHYSIGDLIKPPRMRILSVRYAEKIIMDVSQEIYRILGSAIHMLMRTHAEKMQGAVHYKAEERMFAHFELDGRIVVISGEPDLVTPEGVIDDYKVTAVFGLKKGIKTEWEQQLNGYAMLRNLAGHVTTGLSVTFILRDWSPNETMQADYPPAGAQRMDVNLWPVTESLKFFLDRARLHMAQEQCFDDELMECTPVETWEKPEAWAVIRQGGQRAAKLYRTEDFPDGTGREFVESAAAADASLRNEKLKRGESAYHSEHRPGERTRCLKYCSARSFCSQFKEYSSAAFREPKEQSLA